MSLRAQRALLLFEGVPDLPTLETASGCVAHRASGVLETATAVATLEPELLVIRGDSAWQQQLVRTLPDDKRPAVMMLGGDRDAAVLADEWLSGPPSVEEAAIRVRLARERAKARRRLARRAFVDPLTKLPNRRAVIRALVREAARARRSNAGVSLVLIDLDDFKQVNERRGHQGGDRLLRRVGSTLRRTTRGGELCGRIGGDEFALVVSGGKDHAEAAMRRVRHALEALGVSATCAAGALKKHEDLRTLYRRVDEELLAGKAARRALPRTPSRTAGPQVFAGRGAGLQLLSR